MARSFLIACRLESAPAGKLPAWGGLLDTADERGLWAFAPSSDGFHRLPEGLLWGCFEDEGGALAALDAALAEASALLGYPVQARRRLACETGGDDVRSIAENPFAQGQALLYLLSH